jgi:hypothetical protein
MNRTGLWTEILAPAGALLVAMTAALLRLPALLVLLSLIWFGPTLFRQLAVVGPLDERETEVYRVAQQLSLSVLLVLVTVLPFLLVSAREDSSHPVTSEWLDVGFLVVAIFVLRALVLMHWAVPRTAAAHVAGGGATFIAATATWAIAAYYPGAFPAWVLFAPFILVVPHLVALKWKRVAAVLWFGGAALTALWSVTTVESPLEQVIFLGTLVLPWLFAGYWIATSIDTGAI